MNKSESESTSFDMDGDHFAGTETLDALNSTAVIPKLDEVHRPELCYF